MNVPKWLKYESKIGPMVLVRVSGKFLMSGWVKVVFGCSAMLGTSLCFHAFVVVRDGEESLVRSCDLRDGDLVWLDWHAFMMDGSLVEVKRG